MGGRGCVGWEIFVGASLPHEKQNYLFYLGLPWIGSDGGVGWLVVGKHLTTGLKFNLGARRLPDAFWVKKVINRKLLGVFCHLESLLLGLFWVSCTVQSLHWYASF